MGNSFSSSTATSPSVSAGMTLASARSIVRQFARNAGDATAYTDSDIDQAIQIVGNDFVDITRCISGTDAIATVANDSGFSLSTVDNLTPARIHRMWIDNAPNGYDLAQADPVSLRKAIANLPNLRDTPRSVGFYSDGTGVLYPIPDAAYSVNILWYKPFTAWTAGQADDTITMNLPGDVMQRILSTEGPYVLQRNEVEHSQLVMAGHADYTAYAARCKSRGLGTSGLKTIQLCGDGAYAQSINQGVMGL